MNDYFYIITSILIGLPILVLYATLSKKQIMGGLPNNIALKTFYGMTIVLSCIAGLYTIYYYTTQMPQKEIWGYEYETRGKYYCYFSFLLFLLSSLVWPIGLKFKLPPWIIVMGLGGTALGVLFLLSQVALVSDGSNVAIAMLSILLFQTLLMDLIIWSIFFMKDNRKMNSFGSPTKRTNERLWKRIVSKFKKGKKGGKKGQWSARKAQLAVKEYKEKGGRYKGKRTSNKLVKWTKEDWGTKSGRNSVMGKKATGERYLPRKARKALTKNEYKRTTAAKRRSIKKGKQYSKQPRKISKKTSMYR